MKNDEKLKVRILRHEVHMREAKEGRGYAIQRFDLLIIAICTTGIIIALNIFKVYMELGLDLGLNSIILKFASGFFALTITLNFLSQLSSHRAFLKEEYWAFERIAGFEEENDFDQGKVDECRRQADEAHLITRRLNRIATATLFAGICFLAYVFIFSLGA